MKTQMKYIPTTASATILNYMLYSCIPFSGKGKHSCLVKIVVEQQISVHNFSIFILLHFFPIKASRERLEEDGNRRGQQKKYMVETTQREQKAPGALHLWIFLFVLLILL